MKNMFLAAPFLLLINSLGAQNEIWEGPSDDLTRGKLTVSENQRFLVFEDGTPFFYLGDIAWVLFHRLNKIESEKNLENRRAKSFTVAQAVVLAELYGLDTPNAEGAGEGRHLSPGYKLPIE